MKPLSILCLLIFAFIACTSNQKQNDFDSSSFILNLKLNGVIPYQQALKSVIEKLGRPDSIVNNRYYFSGVSYRKYGNDSVRLNTVDFIKCPETFVSSGKLKLNGDTHISDLKAYPTIDLNSELKDTDTVKYQLLGISNTLTPGYSFWTLRFDRHTGRLTKMELLLAD
jgi:hypothetical protein